MLEELTRDFADGLVFADRERPCAVNVRSKQAFQPGIGPHSEAKTVELVMRQLPSPTPTVTRNTPHVCPIRKLHDKSAICVSDRRRNGESRLR